MRRTGHSRASAVAALALLSAAGGSACSWLSGQAGGAPAEASVVAERRDLHIRVPAKGQLDALHASPVAVPLVSTGALKVKQLVPEGTLVKQGDVILVFDDTSLNLELDGHRSTHRATDRRIDRTQLQSVIESGSIDVMKEVAELRLENAEAFTIVDEEIFSRQEILETEVQKEEASETILFAQASLLLRGEFFDIEERILDVEKRQVLGKIERVESSLGSLVLRAPLGGLILYKKNWRGSSVDVGDTLWPGNVVMSIVDPAETALTAWVLEKDAAGVLVGAEASVTVDARSDREFRGHVKTVAEISRPIESGSPVKYTEVEIEISDGDPALLKPGMKGEARIVTGLIEDAVVVPRSALRGSPEEPYVLISSDGRSERRAVKPGRGDQVLVSIEDGLSGGERVLVGAEPDAPLVASAGSAEPARASP
jgi:HlyD family secretion protein